ncbi:MAG: PDZ domain-containing protein [Clostridia bacterium]|nr:PDZ domain-containing protein [Clostridia bacterium]
MFGINETTTQAEKQNTQDNFCYGGISGRWRYEDCRREHTFRRTASIWVKVGICMIVCLVFGFIGTLGGILLYDFVQNHKSLYYPIGAQHVNEDAPSIISPAADEKAPAAFVSAADSLAPACENVTAELAARYRIPTGVMVKLIESTSALYAAGMRSGDIIVAINGSEVTDIDTLNRLHAECPEGETIVLRVFRSNRYIDISFAAAEEP